VGIERESRESPTWFRPALAIVVVAALVLRVAYVLHYRRDFDPHGDAYFYTAGANLLADGKGFISPFFVQFGLHRAAAEHPPLYVMFLAIPSVLGMKSVLTHLLWSCVLGTGTVGLVGLLGRAVAGARAGVIAAAIAALYPNLWAPDGQLQAETLSMFLVVATLLLAYRYWERPSGRRLALVGAACGLGALARSELILLVPFLIVPLVWTTSARTTREKLQWLGASLAAAAIVVAPWVIYNATRFEHPILLSAQFDPLLASANCDSVYYGPLQGYFDIQCAVTIDKKEGLTAPNGIPNFDESQEDVIYRRYALDYIRGHTSDLPRVEAVRLLRIAGLYKTSLYVRGDFYIEGRSPLWISWAALYSFWVLALLSIGGAVVMRRRARADKSSPPVYPLLAPVVVVVVTVLVTYASTRFRTTAEPSFAVLAAVALDAAWIRASQKRSAPAEDAVYTSARN
jgi:4-amino-4-deoxy-L-arabinose transferase-like glycosyltransferase